MNMSRQSQMARSRLTLTLAAAAAFWPAAATLAQSPDDMRSLDANLSTTSRYNQPRQGFLLNRINEAIVTGTAPGGKSFRGNVGYTSPFAFRGNTAASSLYGFERDSLYSNVATRRTAPRQPATLGNYQVPNRGGAASAYAVGTNVLTPMSGANLQQIARARYGTNMLDVDPTVNAQYFRPLRDTSASLDATGDLAVDRNFTRITRASIMTIDPFLDRGSLYAANTTGLLSPLEQNRSLTGSTGGARPTLPVTPNPLARGIDRTFDGVAFDEGWSNRIAPPSAATPSAASPLRAGQDAYTDYLARLTSKPVTTLPQQGEPYTQETLNQLRDFAHEMAPTTGDAAGGGATTPTVGLLSELSQEQIARISLPTPPIADLAGDNTSQFADHVHLGESALEEGRYFDAESWFDVALYYTPDHPLALAGRVHAQLGSGKYRSAALGLRRLFESHPELINTRYESNLLPAPDRLKAAAGELKDMFGKAGATIEAGLLLAYVGHLSGDRDLVRQGLDELDRTQPDDALSHVLRQVWLAEPAP